MLMSFSPVAVQVGKTSECEVTARYNLYGTYKVLVTGTGVSGAVDTPKAPPKPGEKRPQVGRLKVRFQVAPDALPGVREVRLATPQGASTVGQIVVVRDPVIYEAANNDTMKTAQLISLPATVCGAIERPEDVDHFKFKVSAGAAFTFHVRCQRLQNKIHDLQEHADPILTLKNAAGTVLAMNDNYFFGDPLLYYRFAAAGEYFLEIRDARYSGNPDWQYSIEINDRPFITNVYPSSLVPGAATRLRLIGFNLPADPTATLALPAAAPEGLQWAVLLSPAANSVPIIVSRLPPVLEIAQEHARPNRAQPVAVPAGISGCIDHPGDVDCYAFDAKAGERFTLAIVARDHQSALDSNLRILNVKGERLAENDDYYDGRYSHADSRIDDWTAPADGRYVIEVRDLHLRGGPSFVYFLKVTRSEPHFFLETDTDKTLLAPGMASVIFVRATRKGAFTGHIQLGIEGLPAGVTASCGRILGAGSDGCIVLKAAPTAKQAAANVRITGSAVHSGSGGKSTAVNATAQPLQEIYMPGGGRYHFPVETHTVSVGDPLDLRAVKISTTAVTLKPGESKTIDVTLERRAGFTENVTLDVVYQHLGAIYGNSLPPGVTLDDKASQTLLTGSQVKGTITLKAAPDAKPVENQQIAVMAHVSINFVMKFTYCADPVFVTIVKP
jgi:hypothetical protein